MTPDDFPRLRAAATKPAEFDLALHLIAAGVNEGSIRNVHLQDAKFTLSTAVYRAWEIHVAEPLFRGRLFDYDTRIRDLYSSISMGGLHDVISASKKVAKCKVEDPAVEAIRLFCAEVLPLSMAVASLKDKVVKGRVPSGQPAKPVNPNKVVKTCPVCFRQIAIVDGLGRMVHHGYERPGNGFQTNSCPGIKFLPLEVSNEGLVWLIGVEKQNLGRWEADYAARDTLESLPVMRFGRSTDVDLVQRGSKGWDRAFRNYVARIESEIDHLNRRIPELEQVLADWKPEA